MWQLQKFDFTEMIKSKLVCKLVIQEGKQLSDYTAFKDALESFLLINEETTKTLKDISNHDLKLLLLKSKNVNILVEKSTKIVTVQ